MPNFTKLLSDQTASIGDQVIFECSVFGIPQPLVEFFSVHDNFRIQTGTRISIQHNDTNTHWRLIIKNVTKNDFHEYRAEARNVVGTVNCVAHLKEIKQIKIEPPKILEKLKSIKVKEGSLIEMSVKIATKTLKDEPEPKVEWFKDGLLIKPDNRMCIEILKANDFDEYKLIIKNVIPSDSGEIFINITNSVGSDSSNAKLIVEADELLHPQFTQLLNDVNIIETENATLSVISIGNPTPEIEWLKNNLPINIDYQHIIINTESIEKTTKSSLTINNALLSDAAIYTCKASNKIGIVETTSNFTVQELIEAPKFLNDLKPVKINENEDALFTVKVIGKPEPTIEWLCNEKLIEFDNVQFISSKEQNGDYSLLIKNARLEFQGIISCKATNKVGSVESKTKFVVEELLEKPKFIEELKPLEVKESESGIFSVKITGKPEPLLHWYKDDKPIQIDNKHFVLKEEAKNHFILIIQNAMLEDKGVISCQAINKLGIANSKANFSVQETIEAPKFINCLEPVTIKENQDAILKVDVIGKPQPEILWFKDGNPVEIDNVHFFKKSEISGHYELIIKSARLIDSGNYLCKAINIAGQTETTANFGVIEDVEIPCFIQELKPLNINEGEFAKMTVTVTGKPEPCIEWYKDGNPIQFDSENIIFNKESIGTYSLIIKNARLADAGIYSCKAINKAGKDETMTKFELIEDLNEPKFIEKLKEIEGITGAQIAFECTVTGKPEPKIEWYKDNKLICIDNNHYTYEKNEDLRHTLYINNAKLSDAGTYSCKAVNKIGSDLTLADLSFPKLNEIKFNEEQTKPIFIIPLETKIINEGEEEVNLQCKLNITESKPNILWYHNNQLIDLNSIKNLTSIQSNDGTLTLKIFNATKDQIGIYKCEAINQAGKAETEAHLNYAQQIKLDDNQYESCLSFIRNLSDKKITINESTILECQLDLNCLNDNININWFKDGIHLNNLKLEELNIKIVKMINGTQQLLINCAKFEHFGVFRCEATNINTGDSVWTECHLQVLGKKNFFFY